MKNGLAGAMGEAAAAGFLRKKRYTVVAMNYRSRYGEIDIIAENRRYLVFCEVKLRRSTALAAAREWVDARKQQRLRNTAALWLAEHETSLQPRFDVVEVYIDPVSDRILEINHVEDAF